MDIVHGCSGVTYMYLIKQDFFGLRILHENSLRLPFYRLAVLVSAFFPRVMKLSVITQHAILTAYITSNNQRLANAGDDIDFFFAHLVNKRFGGL